MSTPLFICYKERIIWVSCLSYSITLQRQFRLYISFLGIARPQPQFPLACVCEIPRIDPHISSSRKGRPIVEIYNSLTDTWMWKLGLRPRYSFSGNICFKFSAFCLCSASSCTWNYFSFLKDFNFVIILVFIPWRPRKSRRRRHSPPLSCPRWSGQHAAPWTSCTSQAFQKL